MLIIKGLMKYLVIMEIIRKCFVLNNLERFLLFKCICVGIIFIELEYFLFCGDYKMKRSGGWVCK